MEGRSPDGTKNNRELDGMSSGEIDNNSLLEHPRISEDLAFCLKGTTAKQRRDRGFRNGWTPTPGTCDLLSALRIAEVLFKRPLSIIATFDMNSRPADFEQEG
jgi:hypothetical protein